MSNDDVLMKIKTRRSLLFRTEKKQLKLLGQIMRKDGSEKLIQDKMKVKGKMNIIRSVCVNEVQNRERDVW